MTTLHATQEDFATHPKAFTVTYAHCVAAVPGKPDVAPYTEYGFREVRCLMFRCNDPLLGETFLIETECGMQYRDETKEECEGLVRYHKMDKSRTDAGFDFNP